MESTGRAPKQNIEISSAGRINGEDFDGRGWGTGDAETGAWDFEVTFSRVPREASAFATLVGILILPTIIFGREDDDTTNLLTLAGGDIEFTQLTDGSGVAVQSQGNIRTQGPDTMIWRSEAFGDLQMPEVHGVEPFDAVMLPSGPGRIADVLTFPFLTKRGRELVHAVRNVTFNPQAELRHVQFRRIEIRPTSEGSTVRVITRSQLRSASIQTPGTTG